MQLCAADRAGAQLVLHLTDLRTSVSVLLHYDGKTWSPEPAGMEAMPGVGAPDLKEIFKDKTADILNEMTVQIG